APDGTEVTEALDRSMLAALANLVDDATAAFDGFDYARALERTEQFFWRFCDDYLELVKTRAYGPEGADPDQGALSARAALTEALSTLHRLFAPFLPFTTEEAWSWWMEGSVHRSTWPASDDLRSAANGGDARAIEVASTVLSALRGAKSSAKVGMKTEITRAEVRDTADRLALFATVAADVCAAGRVTELVTAEADEFSVDATLAPPD
ncbi:MAG: class I tRNA ligase family protein, partial [Actinomycetes bacterium]